MQTSTDFPVPSYFLSTHAKVRMQQRGIDLDQLEQVLRFGRTIRANGGASFHVLGRKESRRYCGTDAKVTDAEGVHILLSPEGVVITVYRTHELRKLRYQKQKHSFH